MKINKDFPLLYFLFKKDSLKNPPRNNYVQKFNLGIFYDEKELLKRGALGKRKSYIQLQEKKMWEMLHTQIQQSLISGVKGKIKTNSGILKTMDGVESIINKKNGLTVYSTRMKEALVEANNMMLKSKNIKMFCSPILYKEKGIIPMRCFDDRMWYSKNWSKCLLSIDLDKLDYYLKFNRITNQIIECEFSIKFDPSTSFVLQIIE